LIVYNKKSSKIDLLISKIENFGNLKEKVAKWKRAFSIQVHIQFKFRSIAIINFELLISDSYFSCVQQMSLKRGVTII